MEVKEEKRVYRIWVCIGFGGNINMKRIRSELVKLVYWKNIVLEKIDIE